MTRTHKAAFIALAALLAVTAGIANAGQQASAQSADASPEAVIKAGIHDELQALLETHAIKNVEIDTERAKLAVVFCATAERALSFGNLEHAAYYYRLSLSMSPLYGKSADGLRMVNEQLQSRNS